MASVLRASKHAPVGAEPSAATKPKGAESGGGLPPPPVADSLVQVLRSTLHDHLRQEAFYYAEFGARLRLNAQKNMAHVDAWINALATVVGSDEDEGSHRHTCDLLNQWAAIWDDTSGAAQQCKMLLADIMRSFAENIKSRLPAETKQMNAMLFVAEMVEQEPAVIQSLAEDDLRTWLAQRTRGTGQAP